MYKIQTLNKISAQGLNLFPRDTYEIASEIPNPDAIIVRSADMHSMKIPESIKAIARAGAGTNNIPIPQMTERGIVVFNAPGANANAVKELVIATLVLSSRPLIAANQWVGKLSQTGAALSEAAEKGKALFVGPELRGKRLGVIGLGAVGAMVANAGLDLGMKVMGYDPFISVDGAWALSRNVRKADSLDTLLAKADYISLHVPLTSETQGLINAERIKIMKKGVRIVNLARGELVINSDICAGIEKGIISCFVSDFTDEQLLATEKVICLPHLGASTPEAEENCAVMAVTEIKNFLEEGKIENSVNFPKCSIESPIPENGSRLCIANKNIPNMVGQITTVLANANQNICAMINKNRKDFAYNIIDIEGFIADEVLDSLRAIKGIIAVRVIREMHDD